MSAQEPVSHVDTAWLRMDRPCNLMQIVGVMLFDGALDIGRLKQTIRVHMLAHDRFRQLARPHGTGYRWVEDRDFDLDHHLRRAVLPGDAGKAALQAFVADLAAVPLNPHRPLWEMHLVDTSLSGQALIVRIHHAIADGIALVSVLLSMMDSTAEGGQDEEAPPLPAASAMEDADDAHWFDKVWAPVGQALVTSAGLTARLWGGYLGFLMQPMKALDYLGTGCDVTAELARLAAMPDDSPTRFKGEPGSVKRVAWSEPIALPEVKAVGKVLGVSVNDMLLSAAAGALREYLAAKGDATDGVELRALVPVNLRAPGDARLGNRFGLVALELPVGVENPLARLYAVRERMDALKHSYQAPVSLGILGAFGMLPKLVQTQVFDLLANKATAVMTNVPGPQQALYLAGAKLRQPLFWVPQSGKIGMGVSILSYDGKVQIGLITDKRLVPDPDAIVGRFTRAFEQLLLLVLMEPWDTLADAAAVERRLSALVAQGGL